MIIIVIVVSLDIKLGLVWRRLESFIHRDMCVYVYSTSMTLILRPRCKSCSLRGRSLDDMRAYAYAGLERLMDGQREIRERVCYLPYVGFCQEEKLAWTKTILPTNIHTYIHTYIPT